MTIKFAQKQVQEPVQKAVQVSPTAMDHLVVESTLTELQADVDEMVALSKEIAALKPKIKRCEELRKLLQSIADQQDGAEEVRLIGGDGVVVFSPKSSGRKIKNMQGLIGVIKAKLGYETLLTMINIGLGDIDKYLSPIEAKEFLEEVEGSRKLMATLSMEEAQAQKLL